MARRLVDLTLYEVMNKGGFTLPHTESGPWPLPPALSEHLRQANHDVEQTLDIALGEFRLARADTAVLHAQVPDSGGVG